ncbi:MAG: Beta-alanine degradation protein BauB [Alphaproteobacteria bacterium MarineAlpha9_Bin3]|nr:MAG: Beta-alanine degradation protein BauB [Alphaproteobacteria bacterium MarineAlpha9_Bin3]|tara:strand:+ start:423 stop:710 length:288 start_codon:yes stop_codon:yes gene_type:complete
MARPTVQIDNEFVKVTEWFFPPKSETGHHIHQMDYVVVPMTTGELIIEDTEGNLSKANLVNGKSYSREIGVNHNVINNNNFEFKFIEIEIKNKLI